MPYLTPEADASDTITRVLHIPNDTRFIAAVSGALLTLTRAYNWEQVETGDMTPESAAERAADLFDAYSENYINPMIGCILPYVTEVIPANMLPCDGTLYTLANYPLLAAVIDPALDNGDGTFNTPDLSAKTIVGAGASPYLPFAEGGEEAHALTVTELARHNHLSNVTASVDLSANAGTKTLAATAAGTDWGNGSAVTVLIGQTGNGTPHNNMPPYMALKYGLVFE